MGIFRQHRQNLVEILVLRKADYAVQLLARQRLQLLCHIAQSVGIMTRITYHPRFALQRLPATAQRGFANHIADSTDKGTTADCQRSLLVQVVSHSTCRQYIMTLIVACEVERKAIFVAVTQARNLEILLISFVAMHIDTEVLLGIYHTRFVGCCHLLEYCVIRLICLAQNNRDTLFDNSRLLASNLLDRIAQQVSVFQADICHNAHCRQNNVGGIPTTTQARLDTHNRAVTLRKVVESQCCGHLEERESEFDHLVVMFIDKIDNFLL